MWTEAIRAIPLAVKLLVGSNQQTPSEHLRPVSDLYDMSKRNSDRSVEPEGWSQRLVPLRLSELVAPQTEDTGAKLRWPDLEAIHETGGHLVLRFPVDRQQERAEPVPALAPSRSLRQLPEHARAVGWMVRVAGLSADRIGELVGASRVRVQQWKAGAPIRNDHLRRVMETRDVLQRAMRERPRKDDLAAWLATPDLHEGASPAQLLKDGEFDRARLLAVLSPSAVEPMPDWARRPVAEAWRDTHERRERPRDFLDE